MSNCPPNAKTEGVNPAYRPYRYSELGLAPDGSRTVLLRADNPDRNGPSMDVLRSEGNVVRHDEILSWFLPLGFKPDEADLRELWFVLNTIRVTKPREEAVPLPPELELVAAALEKITESLPVLINMQKTALSAAGPNAVASDVKRRSELLLEFDKLRLVAAALQSDPFFAPPRRKHRTALWHRDLQFIAFLLERYGRKQGVAVSLTKSEGLGVEFVRKALERVGIHHDRQAIAKEMRRAQGDRLREITLAR